MTTREDIAQLRGFLLSERMAGFFRHEQVAFQHGDLHPSNVIQAADGYKIIDWARPLVAPRGVDLAHFLSGMGMQARNHVGAEAVVIRLFMTLAWLVECKQRWFPSGRSYDKQVADLTAQILEMA